VQYSGKSARDISSRERCIPQEPKIMHSRKAFPKAVLALEEELMPLVAAGAVLFIKKIFSKCNTRGRHPLPRAPQPRHSGKTPSSPSAAAHAHGEATLKFFFYFLLFHVSNKTYIYISETKINNNISQTTFIYIIKDQICTKFRIYYKPHVQKYILFQVHKFNT
jgi:hypothetical protein